jgi:hypothetical protein
MKVSSAILALVLSGCGVRSGFLRDSHTLNQIDVRVDVNSVHYVRQARGQSSVGMLFCSIPIGPAQYATAMEELFHEAKLQPNELLVNYREDLAFTAYAFVWCRQTVTVSADIVRVGKGSTPVAAAPEFLPMPTR